MQELLVFSLILISFSKYSQIEDTWSFLKGRPNFRKYIGFPANVESVFSTRAVNVIQNIASLSSFDLMTDNRIKLGVLAQGQGSAILDFFSGNSTTSNGTSFLSLIMTAVIACFWKAFPNKTSAETMHLIRISVDDFSNLTDEEGYGVSNFEPAYNGVLSSYNLNVPNFKASLNPVNYFFIIFSIGSGVQKNFIKIHNILRKKILDKK